MNQSQQKDLRQVLGKFLTGVTVVSTLDQHGLPVGFTANSFTSVSLEPPLVLVCLAQTAGLAPVFRRAQSFAINILADDQEALSNGFDLKDEDRFAGVAWSDQTTGSPVLEKCAAWLDCEMYEKIIAGDHIILIGRVVDASKTALHPLGYYQGRYCSIGLPEETLSRIEHQQSVHATTGILVDCEDRLLLIQQEDGSYDVPRAEPGGERDEPRINAAMARLGLEVHDKVLFSVVEGRHHQRMSIYYRCTVDPDAPLPPRGNYFEFSALPLEAVSRPGLAGTLKRYVEEKQAGQFGIYVGDEHQGHIEQIAERKI